MHEEKGVEFVLQKTIEEIKDDSVVLGDESSIAADVVIL